MEELVFILTVVALMCLQLCPSDFKPKSKPPRVITDVEFETGEG